MKKSFAIFIAACLSPLAFATSVYFPVLDMTGATNDVVINVRAVNNPIIYNGSFHYLPKDGTNLTTSGGYVTNSFVPGAYTMAVAGLSKSWTLYVTNSASVLNAVDLSRGVTIYSGLQTLSATGLQLTNDGYGNFYLINTNGVSVALAGTNLVTIDANGRVNVSTQAVQAVAGETLVAKTDGVSTNLLLAGGRWVTTFASSGGHVIVNDGGTLAAGPMTTLFALDDELAQGTIPVAASALTGTAPNATNAITATNWTGGNFTNNFGEWTPRHWNLANLQATMVRLSRNRPFRVLSIRDDAVMMDEIIREQLGTFLVQNGQGILNDYPLFGFAGNTSVTASSGSAVVDNGVWAGSVLYFANGGAITNTRNNILDGIGRANTVELIHVVSNTFGTLTIKTNTRGGAVGTLATINAATGASGNMFPMTNRWTLPTSVSNLFVSVESSGTNITSYIGIWDTTLTNTFRLDTIGGGGGGWGLETCFRTATDSNFFRNVLQLGDYDAIIMSDRGTIWPAGPHLYLHHLRNMLTEIRLTTDIILTTSIPTTSNDGQLQRLATFTNALASGAIVVDTLPFLLTSNTNLLAEYYTNNFVGTPDGIHTAPIVKTNLGRYVMNVLGWNYDGLGKRFGYRDISPKTAADASYLYFAAAESRSYAGAATTMTDLAGVYGGPYGTYGYSLNESPGNTYRQINHSISSAALNNKTNFQIRVLLFATNQSYFSGLGYVAGTIAPLGTITRAADGSGSGAYSNIVTISGAGAWAMPAFGIAGTNSLTWSPWGPTRTVNANPNIDWWGLLAYGSHDGAPSNRVHVVGAEVRYW